AARLRPSKNRGRVARLVHLRRQPQEVLEAALRIVAKYGDSAAHTGSDKQVFPAIAIRVEPTDSGTELAQFASECGLASEVIERIVGVGVIEQLADVGKQRLLGRCGACG